MKRLGFVVRTMIGVTNRVPIRMQHVLTVLKEVVVCRDSLLCPRPVHIQDAKDATFVQHTVRLGMARESQYHRLHLRNPETRESRPTRTNSSESAIKDTLKQFTKPCFSSPIGARHSTHIQRP